MWWRRWESNPRPERLVPSAGIPGAARNARQVGLGHVKAGQVERLRECLSSSLPAAKELAKRFAFTAHLHARISLPRARAHPIIAAPQLPQGAFRPHRLESAHFDGLGASVMRPDVLILDDFGLKPMRPPSSEDLYEVIDGRYRRGTTILTTNRAFNEWPEFFDQPILASAAIYRQAHGAHQLTIKGDSYRAKGPRRNTDSPSKSGAPGSPESDDLPSTRPMGPVESGFAASGGTTHLNKRTGRWSGDRGWLTSTRTSMAHFARLLTRCSA